MSVSSVFLQIFSCAVLSLTSALPGRAADPVPEREPPRVTAKMEEAVNFSLLDYQGKHYELRRSNAKLVVLFFTSFGCPIARQLVPKLRALQKETSGQGVEIWLVNACPQEDPSDAVIELLVRSRKNALAPDAEAGDAESLRLEVLKAAVGSLPVLRDFWLSGTGAPKGNGSATPRF